MKAETEANQIAPSNNIVRRPAATRATMARVMRSRAMTPATRVTPASDNSLLDNNIAMRMMQEHGQTSCPKEENNLHDTNGKRGLQHRTGLVHIQRKRVIR